jgi:disulfide bond formation protein DsbB
MESVSHDLFELFRNFGVQLISLLTLLICLGIVLYRWKRHPRVSLIAAIGLVLLILHSLIFSVADVWLPRWFINPGYLSVDSFYTILGLATSVTLAIAFAVLLLAVFIDRQPAPPKV